MRGIMCIGANLTQGARNYVFQSDGSAVGTQASTTWIVPSWTHPLYNVLVHGKVTMDTCYDRTHLDGHYGTSFWSTVSSVTVLPAQSRLLQAQ
jgi:hypothetical protein